MNAETWLNQVKKLDQLIDAKLAERDRLKALATDICAKPMDGMPFDNTGTVSQKMQNAVVELIDLSRELDKLIDHYIDTKQKVVKSLEKLPAKEYGILHRYYIRYMTLGEIANDMGYSTEYVCRVKRKALNILGQVIECQ